MPPTPTKYIDEKHRILDPRHREIEPSKGDVAGRAGIVKAVNAQDRTVTGMVSTRNTDRFEEIIEPRAFAPWLEKFMQNPVFLAGHQHVGFDAADPTVLGSWTALEITDDGLQGTAQFLPEGDPLADAYWRRYAAGAMRAFSVGFIVHQWEMREFELEPGAMKKIRVFTEVELLEISAVSVPANRESLVNAASALGQRGTGDHDAEQSAAIARALHETIDQSISAALETRLHKAVLEALEKHLVDPDPDGPIGRHIEAVAEAVARHGIPGTYQSESGDGDPRSADAQQMKDLLRGLRDHLNQTIGKD